MIKVKDLNKDIFPSNFLHYLPATCDFCGDDTEVIESLSYIQCSNPKCISKVGYRLWALLRDLGITIMDIDECMAFLLEYETTNPYSIFLYNYETDGELIEDFGEERSEELYNEINKKRGMLLWEYIKIGHFGNFNESIEKILRDYTSLKDFYEDLNVGGIPFIQNLLLRNTDYTDTDSICVNAVLVYDLFITNHDDIVEGLDGVVIIKPEYSIGVLFANDVTDYKTNKDFLYEVNRNLKNKIYLYPLNILDENVSLVYWEDSGILTHNSIIEDLNNKYTNIPIVNKENIYDKLLGVLSNEKR